MSTTTVTLDLPTRFYDDHRGRDCGQSGQIIKRLSRGVRVELDRAAYDDLLSDADHYASGAMDDMYADDFATASGLIRSAKATLKALRAVEAPALPTPAPVAPAAARRAEDDAVRAARKAADKAVMRRPAKAAAKAELQAKAAQAREDRDKTSWIIAHPTDPAMVLAYISTPKSTAKVQTREARWTSRVAPGRKVATWSRLSAAEAYLARWSALLPGSIIQPL